jgi:hypothetical protein
MPEPFALIINQVLARVRDQGGDEHSFTLCMDLLTRLQRLYNNSLRLVMTTMTMLTVPVLQVYDLAYALQDLGITILKVTHENLPLERMTLSQLRTIDAQWPRARGTRLHGFVQLGYSLLLLWPSLPDASEVVITSTSLTRDLTTLNQASDSLDIPSQNTPKLAQWLELLLLLRQRDMLAFDTLLDQLSPRSTNGSRQASAVAQDQ